jgi:hypothetical protein
LKVGGTLFVFGRVYSIDGCDDFTRNYYTTKYHINFPESKNQNGGQQTLKSSTNQII